MADDVVARARAERGRRERVVERTPRRGQELAGLYDRGLPAFEDLSTITPQQIWDRIAARAVHGDRITLAVIELDPGAVVAEHAHEQEQLGIVIQGSMDFRVGDERRELGPGGTWRIPSNTPHEATAGPDGAVVIDVFAPVRDDWEGLERLDGRAPMWPR